jgi:hemoglobin-like flavoprotein
MILLICCRLFETYPSYQNIFSSFKGQSLDELSRSALLRAHAHTAMQGISTIVDNLEDVETLSHLVEKLVQNHHRRGVSSEHFKVSPKLLSFTMLNSTAFVSTMPDGRLHTYHL